MVSDQLIVCETSSRWEFALRPVMLSVDITTSQVKGLKEAFRLLIDNPNSVLAFEATDDCAEEGLQLLNEYRSHGVIVLLGEWLAESESLWQEAGAINVARSPEQLTSVAHLTRRYIDSHRTSPRRYRETVWQRMPWSSFATESSATSD